MFYLPYYLDDICRVLNPLCAMPTHTAIVTIPVSRVGLTLFNCLLSLPEDNQTGPNVI